jgi:hypothetical protein
MASADDLTWALKHLRARQGLYNLFRDYYRGEHRLAFTTEKWKSEFGRMVKGVADNLCPKVVDTLVDRLELTGFSGPQEERAAEIWKDNRMDLRSGEVHREAAKQGDAFLMVWPGAGGEPTMYLNTADRMCVYYSAEQPGHIEFGVKAWIGLDDLAYATLYYPDRIEKYITRAKVTGHTLPEKGNDEVWEQRTVLAGVDPETGEPINEPWPLDNPYGRVPIFHFANGASLGEYGRSELHDVIPLQDILNKDLSDRLITQEFHSFPQRWAIGLEPDYDADGNAKAPRGGPERLWYTPNTDGKFGQFDAANLEGFVKVSDSDRAEIARVSSTPIHHLMMTGQPPSGEALRTMESPLMAKVERCQGSYGATWEDAMEFAVAMPSGDSDTVDLTATWKDTTSISDKEKAEELVLKQTLGVPQKKLWLELGYTKAEVEEMLQMAEDDAAARAAAFNAGTDTGFESATPTPVPTTSSNGIEPHVLANDITGQ